MVNWSGMGLVIDKKNFATGIEVLKKEQKKQDRSFTWSLGEDEKIENKYRLLVLHCRSTNAKFDIIGRVYNGSFAFKYVCKDLGDKQPTRLIKELTEFNLNNSYSIYQYHEESIFRPMPLDSLSGTSDLPSTLVSGNNSFISIGEAENRNYTK
jgi:alpha-glucosidase